MNKQELITNKQELISKYELLKNGYNFKVVATDGIISDLKRLDEPEKVKVPQFVADWYEEHKKDLGYSIWNYIYYWDQQEGYDFKDWFDYGCCGTIQTLFNMHQFGYEVEKEKEKRYRVKLKSNSEEIDYLVDTITNGFRFYSNIYTQRREHTRKQLEEADFGWVFDCEGIEIEEVE